MRPTAAARETFATAALFVSTGRAIHLRLRAGDERRQTVDAAGIGNHRLRLGLRLILRLRTMFALLAMMLARLLVAVALEGLPLTLLEIAMLIVLAGHERLLLLRHEARLLAEMVEVLALVLVLLGRHFVFGARLRLVLPELLLGGSDQAEIMLGVLVVILGRNRVAG